MKQNNNKFDTKEFFGKLISGGEEPDQKQKPEKRSHIPFRLNFLFFVIFALFVALIARLGYVQIIDAERIAEQAGNSSTVEIKKSTPRGMIYDSKGNVLADNVANAAITYTRGNSITAENILKIAQTLNGLVDVPADGNLSDRDKKDYYLADSARYEDVESRLSEKEKKDDDGGYLSDSDMYKAVIGKVTDDEINALSPDELKIATIFTRMNSASALNTVFVKNDGVTNEELATVAENGKELSGVSTGTDWTRSYTDNDTTRGIIGSISTEQTGLPAEKADEYLQKGYAMNDRVGTSNLELKYEDYLQGKKSISEVKLNSTGNIESQVQKEEGAKGDNLVLTIDSNLQNQVQEIVERNFRAIAGGAGIYSPGAYVVVMNPKTGAVLAMGGVSHTVGTSEIEQDVTGTYLKTFEPGSTIKAATLASGYENGVLYGNDTFTDQPIVLGPTNKSSYYNHTGSNNFPLTAAQALEYSSNSYMMQVAIKLLGREYTPNMSFPVTEDQVDGYNKLRLTYASFGLGVSTGLDLPSEETGLKSEDWGEIDAGKILDLSFGQFDTYSAMQLAQYISTVANGGKRMAAHVVEGVYGNDASGNLDKSKVVKQFGSEVLDEVKISDTQMGLLQLGLYNVVYGSGRYTTGRGLSSSPVPLHAKTGTAETYYVTESGNTVNTVNTNLVAYTDSGSDDIAISVILPQVTSEVSTSQKIALEIVTSYFNSLNQANGTGSSSSVSGANQ